MRKSGLNSRISRGDSVKNKRTKDDELNSRIYTYQNPNIPTSQTRNARTLKSRENQTQRSTYSQLGYQAKTYLSRTGPYQSEELNTNQQKQPKKPSIQEYTSSFSSRKTNIQQSSRLSVTNSARNQKETKTTAKNKTKEFTSQPKGYDILIGDQHLTREKRPQTSVRSNTSAYNYQSNSSLKKTKKQESQIVHDKNTNFKKDEGITKKQITKDQTINHQRAKSNLTDNDQKTTNKYTINQKIGRVSNQEIKNEHINSKEMKDKHVKIIDERLNKQEKKDEQMTIIKTKDEQPNKQEKEIINNYEAKNEQINKPETKNEQINKQETKEEQINKQETKEEQANKQETKEEQINKQETKEEQINKQETKEEQINKQEAKDEKINKQEAKDEKINKQEAKNEQINKQEMKEEQINKQETKNEQINKQEAKDEKIDTQKNKPTNNRADKGKIEKELSNDDSDSKQPKNIMKNTYTPDFNPIFVNQRPPLTEIPRGAVPVDFDVFQQMMMNIQKSILELQKKFDNKICNIQKKIALLEFSVSELLK